ncbi:hypothetical protein NMG60_11016511 [Bertholletia excelsa]
MELFRELLVIAFITFVSTVLAKLVSLALAGGDERWMGSKSSGRVRGGEVVEAAKFEGGLRVRRAKSKRRVQFVEEVVENVCGLEGERSGDELEMAHCEENLEEKLLDSGVPDFGRGKQEDEAANNLDGLVGEEQRERTEADDLDCVGENTATHLVVEEKIVENAEGDLGVTQEENQESRIEEGFTSNQGDKGERLVEEDEDEWEEIEMTELEEVFIAAANYVARENKDHDRLDGDVQMQLYGLHKVAMEGPCHEPQPMVFNVSARAKWNAWQRMGNMSPEVAMERFVTLLTDKIPGWMDEKSSVCGNADPSESGTCGPIPDRSTSTHDQLISAEHSRELELKSSVKGANLSGGSNSPNN